MRNIYVCVLFLCLLCTPAESVNIVGIIEEAVSFIPFLYDLISPFVDPDESDPDQSDILRRLADLEKSINKWRREDLEDIVYHISVSQYRIGRNIIRNAAEELDRTRRNVLETTDPVKRQELVQDYIRYYEINDIKGTVSNILDQFVGSSKLFRQQCPDDKCKLSDLNNVMDDLTAVFLNASKETSAYYFYKYGRLSAEKEFADVMKALDDIRVEYQQTLVRVVRNMASGIETIVERTLADQQRFNDNHHLEQAILEQLSSAYDWYLFAVCVLDDLSIYSEGKYESRGTDYVYLEKCGPDGNKNVVVLWQYKNTTDPESCAAFMNSNTMVFIKGTERSSPYEVAADDRIKTSTECWLHRDEVQEAYLGGRLSYQMPQWIATAPYERALCPEIGACSNRGKCTPIPGSAHRMCICNNGYYGTNCELHYEDNVELESVLASLGFILNKTSINQAGDSISAHPTASGVNLRNVTTDTGVREDDFDYLRSGDTIALFSKCGGYVNCYCTHNSCKSNLKNRVWCTGVDKDQYYNRFVIDSGKSGSPIRHGETVAFKYVPRSSEIQYLSCSSYSSKCVTAASWYVLHERDIQYDELFRIYSPRRRGRCLADSNQCLGEPISSADTVYIKSSKLWLSVGSGNAVTTRSCPGWYLDDADKQCLCEQFTIYLKGEVEFTSVAPVSRYSCTLLTLGLIFVFVIVNIAG